MIVYVLVAHAPDDVEKAVGGIWGVFTDEVYLEEAEGAISKYYGVKEDDDVEFEHLRFELNVVREN